MRVTKYGHSCLLIEEARMRVLIDPGAFSSGFENLTELDALLITHQHQDHLVPEHIKALLRKNNEVKIYADEGSAAILAEEGVEAQGVHEGDRLDIAGVGVEVFGRDHAVIHPKIPITSNVGYLVAGRLFHPGDSHMAPGQPVEVLALPLVAPWTNIEQTIDYALAVRPKLIFPIHDAITGKPEIYEGMVVQLAEPAGIDYQPLRPGQSIEI